jgi:hypothetical protein
VILDPALDAEGAPRQMRLDSRLRTGRDALARDLPLCDFETGAATRPTGGTAKDKTPDACSRRLQAMCQGRLRHFVT